MNDLTPKPDRTAALLYFGLGVLIFMAYQGFKKKSQSMGAFERKDLNEKIVDSVLPWTDMNPKFQPIVKAAATKIMDQMSGVNVKDVNT